MSLHISDNCGNENPHLDNCHLYEKIFIINYLLKLINYVSLTLDYNPTHFDILFTFLFFQSHLPIAYLNCYQKLELERWKFTKQGIVTRVTN